MPSFFGAAAYAGKGSKFDEESKMQNEFLESNKDLFAKIDKEDTERKGLRSEKAINEAASTELDKKNMAMESFLKERTVRLQLQDTLNKDLIRAKRELQERDRLSKSYVSQQKSAVEALDFFQKTTVGISGKTKDIEEKKLQDNLTRANKAVSQGNIDKISSQGKISGLEKNIGIVSNGKDPLSIGAMEQQFKNTKKQDTAGMGFVDLANKAKRARAGELGILGKYGYDENNIPKEELAQYNQFKSEREMAGKEAKNKEFSDFRQSYDSTPQGKKDMAKDMATGATLSMINNMSQVGSALANSAGSPGIGTAIQVAGTVGGVVTVMVQYPDGKIVQGAKAKLTGAFKDNARNTSAGPAVIPGW